MTSKAPDVATYLKDVPSDRKPALEKLRGLCLQLLQGYEEKMDYGMPCYYRNGVAEVGFASQKQHISLYVMKREAVDEFRPELRQASIGKGCIRYSKPEKMDFAVIERLLRRAVESAEKPC